MKSHGTHEREEDKGATESTEDTDGKMQEKTSVVDRL